MHTYGALHLILGLAEEARPHPLSLNVLLCVTRTTVTRRVAVRVAGGAGVGLTANTIG